MEHIHSHHTHMPHTNHAICTHIHNTNTLINAYIHPLASIRKQISSKRQCSLRFLYITYFLFSEHRPDVVSNPEPEAKKCKPPFPSTSNDLPFGGLCVLQINLDVF